jgi:hypothetical protein
MAHWSSCSTNNGPALPPGPCDCGDNAPLSADIILFIPRSNHNAQRAFWKGREPDPLAVMALEIMNQVDMAPEYVAPQKDPP